jgi:hypothetical protein
MHLTRDELLAWRDAPAETDRARIVGHLAVCDECGATYADLIRTRPADDAMSRFDHRAFADRGYAARQPRQGRWLRPRVLVPAAAAAAVLLALALPAMRTERSLPGDPDAVRGSRLETIAPSGEIAGPLEFRWMSPFDGVRYVVAVTDASGNHIATRESETARMIADAPLDATLRPGVRYRWTVSAVGAGGDVIAASAPREFVRLR